jgi:hypothetical protein
MTSDATAGFMVFSEGAKRLAMMPGASAVATQRKLQTTRQTLLKNQINARLKQIKIQIQQVDAAITEKVAQDEALSVTARRC